MTHYYDYYNHKFNSPNTPNPHKAPPKTYKQSQAGRKKEHTQDTTPQTIKGGNKNGKTNPQ